MRLPDLTCYNVCSEGHVPISLRYLELGFPWQIGKQATLAEDLIPNIFLNKSQKPDTNIGIEI